MNRLSTEKRAQVIGCLVEGMSIRATTRITGAAKNTITKLVVDLGEVCADYQDRVLVDLPCKTIEADEIWNFVGSKAKNVPEGHEDDPNYGDVWTWTALDADSKLIVCWYVGNRKQADADAFMRDLRSRLAGRIQLTTDGHPSYPNAVGMAFRHNIDFAQLVKQYATPAGEGRYSPPVCTGARVRVDRGDPDPARISTSYVERQNLTMRMGMRRFTRLTNGFSKKMKNLEHAVSLHYMHYNFARPHSTLANPYPRTPAMAAGVADHVWSLTELAGLLD
jgi:IS1 family transposase